MTSIVSTLRRSPPRCDRGLDLLGDHLHAVFEVAIRRAEAEIRQQFFDQQFGRAAIHVDLGLDVRLDVGERIEIQRDEFDGLVHADRAEGPARDGTEKSLGKLAVRQRVDDFIEPPLDARPDRTLLGFVTEATNHQLDGAVHIPCVQFDALDRVFLAAAPIAFFEALAGPLRDCAKIGVVIGERVDQRLRAFGDQRVARNRLDDGKTHRMRSFRRPARTRLTGSGSGYRRIRCT